MRVLLGDPAIRALTSDLLAHTDAYPDMASSMCCRPRHLLSSSRLALNPRVRLPDDLCNLCRGHNVNVP